jgi:polyferredoxin
VVTLWIGYEFYRFVSYYETGGTGAPPTRPPGVESFLPISGLMGLRDWFLNGVLNNVHPSAAIILLLAIVISVLWKKSFCGWVCPVGFLSESVASVGRKVHGWKGKMHWLPDGTLRSLKYMLLAFFGWAIFWQMTPESITAFINSPYNRIADIKMLKFFTEFDSMTFWSMHSLVVLGFLVSGFWCRYLCPYGALLGVLSFLSPWKITRKAASCTDCNRCNVVCPVHINISQMDRVRSDECNACLACVDVCPASETLALALPKYKLRMNRRSTLVAVTAVFVLGIGVAIATDHWQNAVTHEEYQRRIQEMDNPKYQHNQGTVPEYKEGD